MACGALYLLLGELGEAVLLLAFVILIIFITIYQEYKTERALEALRDLSSPRALVIRDSDHKRIAGREVVCGDIIIVSEGDRIPADAWLIHGASINLSVDESMLTGESVPVTKLDMDNIYSGSLVVKGQGVAEVHATGRNTEMGKIGKALNLIEQEKTLLQKETSDIVKVASVFSFVSCMLLVIIYGLNNGNWLEGMLAGIALAMGTIPEEFPVVLTLFLALGAWRISRKSVLTRRVPAIETLGAANVLCVDKTGTLTLNQMKVAAIKPFESYTWTQDDPGNYPESHHSLLEYAILASQIDPFDPMEKAILDAGKRLLSGTEHLHTGWNILREYPLTPDLLAVSNVWISTDGEELLIASKGAPEAIIDLCHLDPYNQNIILEQTRKLSSSGLRVLGAAKSTFRPDGANVNDFTLPNEQHDYKFEFLGLIGLIDPVRDEVPDAINECYSAGMRTIMITGDYPGTARNIAAGIGLKKPDLIITGQELDRMDDVKLRELIRTVNVFARVVPEQKLRIVNAFKSNGDIVAMTGDGVNDAPALKSAHIGIAMGGRGTDVAREAAALVLTDDSFTSIVAATRLGRRIYDNIRKALSFVVSVHVPIAGMSLLPVFLEMPLALHPVHIVFLELVIDPACTVVFEAEMEEEGIMKRPPRSPSETIFNRETLSFSFIQGLSTLAVVFSVYILSESSTLAFSVMLFSNLALILSNRSWSHSSFDLLFRFHNVAFWFVFAGASLFLFVCLYFETLRRIFHFELLGFTDILLCVTLGILMTLYFDFLKTTRIASKR
jgi:Ca2+-transporting ATPase